MPKPKRKPPSPRRSATARTMLKTLREFRGDFSTVTMAPDGTISVTYAPPAVEAPKTPKAELERLAKERHAANKPPMTAIEALSAPTPRFDFEVEN